MSIEYTPGPLLTATRTTPTVLWNDSADPDELTQSISFGGVGGAYGRADECSGNKVG